VSEDLLVSVVIPTYRRIDKTIEAVKSVVNQTVAAFEIIVVQDEISPALSEALQNHNLLSFVKVIQIEHSGLPARVRNIGISHSRGNWIGFLDSDDVWMPQKLEKQITLMLKMNINAICSNAIRLNEQFEKSKFFINEKSGFLSFYNLLQINKIICSSVIIHKSLICEAGNFNESRILKGIEDYDLWLRISQCTNWYFISDELLYYNDDSVNSIRNDSISPIFQKKFIIKSHLKWLLKRNKFLLELINIIYLFLVYFLLICKIKILKKNW
jgi:glycosyltransferase involved in cell wall biosynthesis